MTSRWLLMPWLAMALPSAAWAQERPWDWGHPMMWGWGMGMMVMMLVFWGLVIGGVVLLVRWLAGLGSGREGGGRDRALEILRERYARGEIDREEFESRRRDLA
jgi:putative membrane protein